MKLSFLFIALTIFSWGVWGFFNKLAVQKIGQQAIFWNTVVIVIVMIGYLYFSKQLLPIKLDASGIVLSLIAGIATSVATVFFYLLLAKQPVGYLVAVTALYPIITLILSMIFLRETLTITKIIGFLLAFAALFFLNL